MPSAKRLIALARPISRLVCRANSLRSDSALRPRRDTGRSLLLCVRTRFAQTARAGVGGTSAVLAIAAVGIVLFLFDPATAGFYPPCLFKSLFGWPCPGCGSLRALHQLLHGRLAAAWELNRNVVIALPLAAILEGVRALRGRLSGRRPPRASPPWPA